MGVAKRSVLQQVLGSDFAHLHPKIQRQYAITSESNLMNRGTGVMSEVTRGSVHVLPFLHMGATRNILFPESGTNVDFVIENYAYVDPVGRETITWNRTFMLPKVRRFDEYLVYSEQKKGLVVYAGSHQHLAVDLHATVDEAGALCLETGEQRVYESKIHIRFPNLFSGSAVVRESYCDEKERFEIDVKISNPVFGHIFGYTGWFSLEHHSCEQVPDEAKPKRTEARY